MQAKVVVGRPTPFPANFPATSGARDTPEQYEASAPIDYYYAMPPRGKVMSASASPDPPLTTTMPVAETQIVSSGVDHFEPGHDSRIRGPARNSARPSTTSHARGLVGNTSQSTKP
ncbi:hypothetical protein BM1_07096 [Bipolaris maydis]|nr:hypothetical protein BM1_07096 [Bipolaris maydis]